MILRHLGFYYSIVVSKATKHCSVLLIIGLFATVLQGQIQQLPDIQVIGENPVKALLYKKALPFNIADSKEDSLPAFLPKELPEFIETDNLLHKLYPRTYVDLTGNTLFGLDGLVKYYIDSELYTGIDGRVSLKAPSGNITANLAEISGCLNMPWGDLLGSGFRYINADGKGLKSEYTGMQINHHTNGYDALKVPIDELITELRIYRIWQNNSFERFSNTDIAVDHRQSIDLSKTKLRNHLLYSMNALAFHGSLDVPYHNLENVGIHVLADKYSFIPSLGFRYKLLTGLDQQLSITNNPQLKKTDYPEVLEQYQWVSFKENGRNTLLPVNLLLLWETRFPTTREFQLRSLRISNRTQYKVNDAYATQSMNPKIPTIAFTNIFANESLVSAEFGEGEFTFRQDMKIDLSFYSKFDWIRSSYNALLKVESSAIYKILPWTMMIRLNQHYFSLDHKGSDLPEVIDFSVGGEYSVNSNSTVYATASNLFNSRKWIYRTLPSDGAALFLGVVHRF